jgi:hypothetical protein
VGVDHRGAEVFVAQELLDGSDVVAGFEQVGRERVPEGMASGWLVDAGSAHRLFHRALEDCFMDVVSTLLRGL